MKGKTQAMKSYLLFFLLFAGILAKSHTPLAVRSFDLCQYPSAYTNNGIQVGPSYGPNNINKATVTGNSFFILKVEWNNCNIRSFTVIRDQDTLYKWPLAGGRAVALKQAPGSYSIIFDSFELMPKLLTFQLLPRTVGVEESTSEQIGISVFPNPANDLLNISSEEPIAECIITNLCGQPIERIQVEAQKLQFTVGHIPKGVYLIKILTRSKKFCVKKLILE